MNLDDLKNQFTGTRTEKALDKIAGELEQINETLVIMSQQLPALYDLLSDKDKYGN